MNPPETHPWVQITAGIRRQTITTGATMYQMRAELAAGSRLPEHQHPQEQITHLLSGRLRLIVAGVAHELAVGESCYIAGDVLHAVETIEDSCVLDTFSPPREDYLAADRAAASAR
ncbi:MAG: cupin domain-containing protein [Verrucomicrobiota bacterium]|nr:cupin domain-containing protein [Verrucomicrobiota bacterium]